MPPPKEQTGSVSNLDLTTVQNVKDWIGNFVPQTSDDDALIQGCITSWGFEFLLRTGQGDQNFDFAQSPFNSVCPFTEVRDGNGNYRMFLKNRPAQAAGLTLNINGIQIAQSGAVNTAGWVLDGTGKSIALRGGLFGWGTALYGSGWGSGWQSGPYRALAGGLCFWKGIANVVIQYNAGYAITPYDIVQASNIVVTQNYKRRKWADEASRSASGGMGATRFRDWAIPPDCQDVVFRYSRTL